MKKFGVLALTLLSACGSPATRPQSTVMDQIEREVILPVGARSLEKYARLYTNIPNGQVVGIYVSSTLDNVPVGQRKWFKDIHHISKPNGVGCEIVYVIYDLNRKRVTAPFCEREKGDRSQ